MTINSPPEPVRDASNYIFPKKIADKLAKIDQRTQYEASMMSMTLMMIGMLISVVYMFFYMDLALWFRINLVINGFLGIIFMGSYLVTTFQQYKSYMQFQLLQQAMMNPVVVDTQSLNATDNTLLKMENSLNEVDVKGGIKKDGQARNK